MTRASPEDLIDIVTEANSHWRQEHGHSPTHFNASQRIWIEPLFNLLGYVWGTVTRAIPWVLHKLYVHRVVAQMGGHAPEANPALGPRAQETVRLAKELHAKTKKWPALLVAMSHPETEGPLEWLRFE